MSDLAGRLRIDRQDDDTFTGVTVGGFPGRSYGGHVASQALHAAGLTVEEARAPHSLHVYFAAGARSQEPITYRVEHIRDGGNFSLRQVTASQEGTRCLMMMCSFSTSSPSWEHQTPVPEVGPPESVPLSPDLWGTTRRETTDCLDVRTAGPFPGSEPLPPHHQFWIRSARPVGDSALLNACALTYISDLGLSRVADRPHLDEPGRSVRASLDHAIWFHRRFDAADWLLVDLDGPTFADHRGLGRSQIFSRDMRLVASVAQEALVRRIG